VHLMSDAGTDRPLNRRLTPAKQSRFSEIFGNDSNFQNYIRKEFK
jgi:hypothetical protein